MESHLQDEGGLRASLSHVSTDLTTLLYGYAFCLALPAPASNGAMANRLGSFVRKIQTEWGGPDDLSAEFQFCWDKQYRWFHASVWDEAFFQPHCGSNTWRGDSIQIAVSEAMPWTDGDWRDTRDHEISLALTSQDSESFRTSGPALDRPVSGAELTVERNANVTCCPLALPWQSVTGRCPAQIRLALYVNDNDDYGRKGYPAGGDLKRLDRLHAFELVPYRPRPSATALAHGEAAP